VLSIKGNGNVLLKLALTCRLWTESHLPSLKGNKAIDNRVYTRGTERSRCVINTRPKPQLTNIQAHILSVPTNHIMRLDQAASNKRLDK
jgi:hypothetical protein